MGLAQTTFSGHLFFFTLVLMALQIRVPTQIAFSNSLCFPCFFSIRLQIFPVPIYVICDYNIHKTDLADISSFKNNWEFVATNIEISFTFRIREFTTRANQIPCILATFPNSLFSLTGICCDHFPCFPCAVYSINDQTVSETNAL